MTGRGKFCSLTLINWNGFFARTFDLDQLVTTLSGGNGAGKSTTMAAFITALIPDLTLLHFRNTTEAGATSGSRDKGLYGKLRPGVCYAVLDVENSLGQRVLAGVRLQQVAGRNRKVDIKPFSIQDLPASIHPAELLTETVDGRQARVLPLTELKDKFEDSQCVQFRQYNAITDYHALMFDLGMVARRMKTSADRSKYYRLMEASLYGGISSAITRSLRDYLLPENSGVRKAFQDMEAALRENRMTLEAIRVTQSDREMFKHLISEATSYVAADYMRHANERRQHLDGALQLRQELALTQKQQAAEQERHVEMASELAKHTADEAVLESEYQRASDHLNLVQTAVRQQEKITRYEADLDELRERLEVQSEIAEEARETEFENAARSEAAELEVDELKNQLADYQQALDVQQTRAIQYQQAQHALERARDICQLPDLNIENAMEWQNAFHQREREATDTLLGLEQKLSMAEAAHSQFEQAFALVCKIGGPVSRSDAWQIGRDLLRDAINQRHRREQLTSLRARLAELEQRLLEQQEAKHLLNQFCTRQGREYDVQELPDVAHQLDELTEQLSERVSKATERQLAMGQQREQLSSQLTLLTTRAPQWLMAQELLLQLREQSGMALADSQQMTEYLQHLLEQERGLIVERDNIAVQKREAERQIERLSQPGGAEDSRLNQLADRFGGVLLSEIYDDVTLDDAPWFSALYGPARHAIVVPDLSLIRDQLNELQDCPEDLYLIEGDPQAFDESVFNAEELEGAVVVKVAERQWRYSRFPKVPLFGRAARENQLERLRAERSMLNERFATFSFDVQKTQRLHQSVSRFIGSHITVAFDPDPEAQIRQLNSQRSELERALSQHESENQRERQQYDQVKESTGWLNQLLPRSSLLGDDTLQDRYDEIVACLEEAQEAAHYLQQHDAQLVALESVISVLQNDPKQHDQLKRDYQLALEIQRKTREQAFALAEVVQRRAHLSYQDAAAMLDNTGSLNEQLRRRLEQAEGQRRHAREQLRQHQQNLAQQNQTLASLKSAYDAKEDMYKELLQEMHDIGVKADASAEARARQQRDEIYSGLSHNRARRNQLEKQLTLCEAEIDGLQKKLKRVNRDYLVMREQVVTAKAGWCAVMCLVKEHGMERRLHKRELAYLGSDELRSMSDKALGALRLAVADNEHLRDLLRGSEDAKRPERKIQFFIAVYQHLRERIRQDIIATDDPVDAIEQMEIELSRLTEELTAREQTLAISSHSVANIIRKTIQREQLRIRQLNQGLRSVSFGQVNSVRLNVNVRESHSLLLDVLSQQHEQHQDLFTSNRLTFSEALARLYQRLNPQIDMGQRTPQTIGEALLDYRNYLEMEVEVNRGSDGWLRAESGALSTGEAIGTGMSILVMVVQSWEEESRRLRGKDISPCRLLFLDEAARLDARSINTLFELCERLEMQLIIAAPENISPEKGTTYKLVRKVINNSEHVHVVGLRGFSSEPDDAANTDPLGQLQFESR